MDNRTMGYLVRPRSALQPYDAALRREGWDSWEAISVMPEKDMEKLRMLPGRIAITIDAIKEQKMRNNARI